MASKAKGDPNYLTDIIKELKEKKQMDTDPRRHQQPGMPGVPDDYPPRRGNPGAFKPADPDPDMPRQPAQQRPLDVDPGARARQDVLDENRRIRDQQKWDKVSDRDYAPRYPISVPEDHKPVRERTERTKIKYTEDGVDIKRNMRQRTDWSPKDLFS